MKYCAEYWKEIANVASNIPHAASLKDKKIILTGATGLIGSAVADILFYLNKSEGYNIKILLAGRSKSRMRDRFYCMEEGKDYHFVEYDAERETNIEERADYVVFGASYGDPKSISSNPVEVILSNTLGLNELLKYCVNKKVERLLFISSSEVYGKKDNYHPFNEKEYGYVDLLNVRSCYPNAKRLAETMCVSYGKEYGLDTVIVRPGHIYGPTITLTDSRASAQFSRNAKNKEDIVLKSSGQQLRSYCHTFDCASAILTVLLNGKKGEAYNISNPEAVVTIRELANAFAKSAGRKLVFENATVTEVKSYNMMDNSSLTSDKLLELGWKGNYNLNRGVENTLRYMD